MAQTLTKQLVAHIRSCLPALIESTSRELGLTKQKLSQIGKPVPDDKQTYLINVCFLYLNDDNHTIKFAIFFKLLYEYSRQLRAATEGGIGVRTTSVAISCNRDGTLLDALKSHSVQLFSKAREAFEELETEMEMLMPSELRPTKTKQKIKYCIKCV